MDISSMHSLNHIRSMEVIDVNMGAKLGYIKDLKVDCDNCQIISILMPEEKVSWFGKSTMKEIPWEDVVKIGVDVILVNYDKNIKEDI